MSLHDREAFLKSIHPFEFLSSSELTKTVNSMDIAYYKKDKLLISPNSLSNFLHIIIKGEVGEYHGDDLVKVYANSNTFDADSLIYNKTDDTFIVLEELICFEMKKEDFTSLLESNSHFKNYFIKDLANRIQSAKQKEYSTQMSGFMIARVCDSYLHKPCIVDENKSIMDSLSQMEKLKTNCILVLSKSSELGIVTDSILRKHILYDNYDKFGPIGPIALSPIISIDYDDFLFNALLCFTKNSIKRVVVTKGNEVVGILEQLDLLSLFCKSYLFSGCSDKKSKYS